MTVADRATGKTISKKENKGLEQGKHIDYP